MALKVQNKHDAKRATVFAQIAALVFVVAAGAAGLKGIPWLAIKAPVEPSITPEPPKPSDTNDQPSLPASPIDALTISENLMGIANAPTPDAAPTNQDPGTALTTNSNEISVQFVGSIVSRTHATAFVKIGDETKMLKPGQQYAGVKLLSIEDDQILITINDGDEQTIDKAERTASAVTVVTGGAANPTSNTPAGAGNIPDNPAFRLDPNMSPEKRRSILREQAKRQRDLINRNREGLSPDRNNR